MKTNGNLSSSHYKRLYVTSN